MNEKTVSVFDLARLSDTVTEATEAWNYNHLNLDTNDFRDKTSTGENIVRVLWSKLESSLGDRLFRLRLWETENNRFSLRRGIPTAAKKEGT